MKTLFLILLILSSPLILGQDRDSFYFPGDKVEDIAWPFSVENGQVFFQRWEGSDIFQVTLSERALEQYRALYGQPVKINFKIIGPIKQGIVCCQGRHYEAKILSQMPLTAEDKSFSAGSLPRAVKGTVVSATELDEGMSKVVIETAEGVKEELIFEDRVSLNYFSSTSLENLRGKKLMKGDVVRILMNRNSQGKLFSLSTYLLGPAGARMAAYQELRQEQQLVLKKVEQAVHLGQWSEVRAVAYKILYAEYTESEYQKLKELQALIPLGERPALLGATLDEQYEEAFNVDVASIKIADMLRLAKAYAELSITPSSVFLADPILTHLKSWGMSEAERLSLYQKALQLRLNKLKEVSRLDLANFVPGKSSTEWLRLHQEALPGDEASSLWHMSRQILLTEKSDKALRLVLDLTKEVYTLDEEHWTFLDEGIFSYLINIIHEGLVLFVSDQERPALVAEAKKDRPFFQLLAQKVQEEKEALEALKEQNNPGRFGREERLQAQNFFLRYGMSSERILDLYDLISKK